MPDRTKLNHFRLILQMFPDMLLHPHHVIPTVKLISTLMKSSHHLISHSFMKSHTIVGQIAVFGCRVRDAGIHIYDVHLLQFALQCLIQFPSDSKLPFVPFHINRYFDRPVICFPFMKR